MTIKWKNNAASTLAAGITATSTTITVKSGEGSKFPLVDIATGSWCYLTIINQANFDQWECVYVTKRVGDVFTVIRGDQSTQPQAWTAGTMIVQYITTADTSRFITRNDLVYQYVQPPIGTIVPYTGASAPSDYLKCDGTTYDILDKPYLFDVIGNTYGGDGITSFRVPNLQDLFIRGMNNNSSGWDANRYSYNNIQAEGFSGHNHGLVNNQVAISFSHDPHFSDTRLMGDYWGASLETGSAGSGVATETAPYHAMVNFIIRATW